MIKRYSIRPCSLRISLFFSLIFLASCTYDYFEDETNYVVYAPKANNGLITDEYRIEDIHIYIYNSEAPGHQRRASFPFRKNARMKLGNFNFRLFPGSYTTYCFANTGEINFHDMASWQEAAFGLPESDSGEYHCPASFASFSIEYFEPSITFPGPLVTDTAYFAKRYSGKICVAFKALANLNPLLTYGNIGKVKVEATGTGTFQSLSLLTDSIHTRSGSYSPSDKVMMEFIPYENPLEGYDFGIDGYFFPSLSDGRPISLFIYFLDHSGNPIHSFPMDVTETLHMNQTIYLGTDGISALALDINSPEEWDPGIIGDGGEMEI